MDNMAELLWEMYKRVHVVSDDEFYHVLDLKFFVHRMTNEDFF